jgi:PAS domain S-box-containing protein
MAACLKEQVIAADIAADTRWAATEWRALALSHGLRACWSTPILSSDESVLGTFAIYWREPRSPTSQDHKIIGQITHLAAVAIERNRTEAALQQSEERFRRMADNIPEVIWFTALDPEKVLYVSPSFERIWGLRVEDIYANPRLWTEMIHPHDRERVKSTFSRWAAGEQVSYHNVEYRIVQPGGAIRWIHERGVLSLNQARKPCLASGISTDITERKRAEEELRRSEAYLAEAQRLSLTGSFGWNVSTGKIIWSKETYCILGYDQAMEPNLDLVFKRVHPEDITLVQQTIDQVSRDGTDLDFEHRLLMPDGSIKHVHLVARGTKTESGAIEFVGAVMDVTEQRKIEQALRAAEKLARGQVEALKSALDALAMESAPDRLVEHILRTLTEQFRAHSSSVWRRDEATGMIGFEFAFEDGRIVKKTDSRFSGMDLWLPMENFWPWPEVFRTGKPSVIEDIRTVRSFALRDRLLPLGIITVLLVPMSVVGRLEGAIGLRFIQKRPFRPEEMDLAQALANQAMLAIQLNRLSAESRESAVMAERNRMARDIHDTLAQGFTGVIVQLEAAADAKSKGLAGEEAEHLSRAGDLARESLKEARRSVRALRPQALEEKDLCQALEDLIRKMTAGTTVRAEFILQGEPRKLPPEWEANLLRVGQEVLTNALRHAHASEFKTQLVFGKQEIRLELRDNGRGFDPAGKYDGFGLTGMRERVEGMGGQLTFQSVDGAGTEILIVLPLTDNSQSLRA